MPEIKYNLGIRKNCDEARGKDQGEEHKGKMKQ